MKWLLTACSLAALSLMQPGVGGVVSSGAGVQPVTVPAFDAEPGIQWSSSRQEYEAARADERYTFEQFTYQSDNLTVGAYLYRPRQRSARALPVVVYNRGGYTRPHGFAGEMLVMANRYARAGFIVVAPHYRGSSGWQGRDEMGGAELADLMNIAGQLSGIHGADAARVYLAGESRGGMMVYQAIRDGFPARAAAVWGAFNGSRVAARTGLGSGEHGAARQDASPSLLRGTTAPDRRPKRRPRRRGNRLVPPLLMTEEPRASLPVPARTLGQRPFSASRSPAEKRT